MAKAPNKVEKIKVAPYPINAMITGSLGSQTSVMGQIVKLTTSGFLIELSYACVPGQKYDVTFTLPVVGTNFHESVVVVKSYDRIRGKTDGTREIFHLFEFHFKSLQERPRVEILNFLRRIGQVK